MSAIRKVEDLSTDPNKTKTNSFSLYAHIFIA